jgi:hypothetical protein
MTTSTAGPARSGNPLSSAQMCLERRLRPASAEPWLNITTVRRYG